ncbi:RNA polymerase sigma factor [Sphingobacterium bovistauri]|uniref:Sigma-70 family RNA polymerase sigma factor n=1 Tax=Sphingobacterium bovistauri TaxID=2781959 RepID=A0ABS7Z848_9SPHI|nr:sigma-70 family RNA polymerase sigma factor [Sphingobacterium bovistauri]MCA5006320.1 sigma-70 family RNA polymerase sigma factor [Sphingobacterium bovistauri]
MRIDISKVFDNENYLIAKLVQSDHHAFEYIFNMYYPRICIYALQFTTENAQAEDIAKEAFIRIWKAKTVFKSIEHLKNTLYQSARQIATNYQVANQRSINRELIYQMNQEQHEEHAMHNIIYTEVMSELYNAIQKLPEQAKNVIISTYLEGKSNQEVAQEMSLSLQTVKNYKLRGIKQLRQLLSSEIYILLIATNFFLEKN